MRLKYAHLADYASASGGKLTLVGVFANVIDQLKVRPIPFPQFHLVAVFEGHISEGTEHNVMVRFLNEDGQPSGIEFSGDIKFAPTGRGRPIEANLLVGFPAGLISVPDHGDYEFRFQVDGHDIGGVTVSVVPPVSG